MEKLLDRGWGWRRGGDHKLSHSKSLKGGVLGSIRKLRHHLLSPNLRVDWKWRHHVGGSCHHLRTTPPPPSERSKIYPQNIITWLNLRMPPTSINDFGRERFSVAFMRPQVNEVNHETWSWISTEDQGRWWRKQCDGQVQPRWDFCKKHSGKLVGKSWNGERWVNWSLLNKLQC